jgi:Uma2 family endonuclease
MIETPFPQRRRPEAGEPIWEIAHLYPYQGDWSEADYLALETNHLVEFDEGHLEFLPMPTLAHQDIVAFLYELFLRFVRQNQLGRIYFAPLPMRLGAGKYREPDLLYISRERRRRTDHPYAEGADLVVEVVSGGEKDRERDLVIKRAEYARAGIPEYWIVDPAQERIIVLTLRDDVYEEHGVFGPGQKATSVLLNGFEAAVTAVFAAPE